MLTQTRNRSQAVPATKPYPCCECGAPTNRPYTQCWRCRHPRLVSVTCGILQIAGWILAIYILLHLYGAAHGVS